MVKPLKRTKANAFRRVPVRWRDESWSVRVQVVPEGSASFVAAVLARRGGLKNAFVQTLSWPLERVRRRQFARRWECARFAGATASLPVRRNRVEVPCTPSASRTGGDTLEHDSGSAFTGLREPLLALAALPLGGNASVHLNLCHLFENTASRFL